MKELSHDQVISRIKSAAAHGVSIARIVRETGVSDSKLRSWMSGGIYKQGGKPLRYSTLSDEEVILLNKALDTVKESF